MSDYSNTCDICGEFIEDFEDDYRFDDSGEYHESCYDKWMAQQEDHWRPLYEGEKRAGLIPDPKYPREER